MEVGRIALGLGFLGMAAFGFASFTAVPEALVIRNAALHPMGDALIFVAQIDNPGRADRLTGIGSEAAARALITKPDLVVPAGSAPTLAMDGAHGVLMGVHGSTDEGRLIPVTLWFERLGDVSTRARIVGTGMDHSAKFNVPEGEPSPALSLQVAPDGEAWRVALEVDGFTFSEEAVDGPHQPGVGHAHLYLNGLKLQRLYGTEAVIGALPEGAHEVRVTLNTNDHRSYAVDGKVVSAAVVIAVGGEG